MRNDLTYKQREVGAVNTEIKLKGLMSYVLIGGVLIAKLGVIKNFIIGVSGLFFNHLQ